MNDKFIVIDGHALIYRSYFAFANNHRITKKGFVTSAIYGFTNILLDIIKKQTPQYMCIAFDTKAKTWRHDKLLSYKANRPKQPDDITNSFKYIFNILDNLKIKYYSKEGYEADDIIGTISKLISDDISMYIITPDKDYDQLVKKNVFLFKPHSGKYIIINEKNVLAKWGINNTRQVIDALAIIGDKCDNINGIEGIGIKTASKLIKEYGSIENIIINSDNINETLKSKFINNLENLILSKELVTIKTDCDFDFNIDDCKLKTFNIKEIENIFNELEFNSLLNKVSKINLYKTQNLF